MRAKIIQNKSVGATYYHAIIDAPLIAKTAKPGQFVSVRISSGTDPLLRRPFGIHRVLGTKIEIVYEVIGLGTRLFAHKKTGDMLDIIGPLGNGFTLMKSKGAVIIAGGMGVVPLLFLADTFGKLRPRVLIGARTKSDIVCEASFKKLGCEVKISTDDGSRGHKGRVTELLETLKGKPSVIYACGPKLMLKSVALIAAKLGIPAQLSLEAHMSCSIGACLGCVVNTKSGFQRVCKEGPIFSAGDIIW